MVELCMVEEGEVLSLRHTAQGGALFLGGISPLKFREGMENKFVPDL